MIQAWMQSNLFAKLLHHLELNHFTFHHFFQSNHKSCFVVSADKYLSEFTFTQCFAHLEAVCYFWSFH